MIYVSLAALSIDPGLWRRVPEAGDEALLLRKADFEAPRSSPAFALLTGHPDRRIRDLAGKLAGWCECASLGRIPALKDATPLAPPWQPVPAPAASWGRPTYTGGLSGPVAWPDAPAPGRVVSPPPPSSSPPASALAAWAAPRSISRPGVRLPRLAGWKAPDFRLGYRWRSMWNRLRRRLPRGLPSRRVRAAAGVAGFLALFVLWTQGILPRDGQPAAAPPMGASQVGGACALLKPPPPGIEATPVAAAGGPLRIDFRIISILACPDRLRLDIAVVRAADRPLKWTSDDFQRGRIYLESRQGRHPVLDMGGVFAADAELQPGLRYDGWLEFARPEGDQFTLVYPDVRPVPIDLGRY